MTSSRRIQRRSLADPDIPLDQVTGDRSGALATGGTQ
jgi:hypothetical protein